MTIVSFSPEYVQLADDIYRCRFCRERSPTFARECGLPGRHPEMAFGSPSPKILIVSINPKFDENRRADVGLAAFMAKATTPSTENEANPFDRALRKALPAGYSFRSGNVTNTRVYKCATPAETKVEGVARTCTDRFLLRELRLMKPCVVLGMGRSAWDETFRVLNAGPVPSGQGPHARTGTLDGRPTRIVACWHLSGNVQARSDSYRFDVRRLICDALGIARNT
jgi:hypothetical protein